MSVHLYMEKSNFARAKWRFSCWWQGARRASMVCVARLGGRTSLRAGTASRAKTKGLGGTSDESKRTSEESCSDRRGVLLPRHGAVPERVRGRSLERTHAASRSCRGGLDGEGGKHHRSHLRLHAERWRLQREPALQHHHENVV